MKFPSGMIRYAGDGLRRVFYLDLRMLALFRMGLGGVVLADLIQRSFSFQAHYGQAGLLPVEEALWFADFSALLPLHLWFASDPSQICLFLIQSLAAIALVLGVQTRVSTVVCWLLVNSLQLRNPVLLYGADRELAALLLWAMFLPLGAKWSLDARQRCHWTGVDRVYGWAAAGLILQVGLIYFTSVLSKSGETWRDGSAILLALNVDVYTRSTGRWLLQFGESLKWLTFATLIIECLAPCLLVAGKFERGRWFGCLALIFMQCGFLCFLSVGLFPWISMVGLVALIPGSSASSKGETKIPARVGGGWGEGCAAVLFFLMVYWQIALVPSQFKNSAVMGKIPDVMAWVYRVSRLAQSWSMFSPDPPDRDGWFVMQWIVDDTKGFDLFRRGAPVNWSKPTDVDRMFRSERWKEWMLKVQLRGLKWDRTVERTIKEVVNEKSLRHAGDGPYSYQVRLWYLEESYDAPGKEPLRHLLFEKSYTDAISTP